MQWLAALLALDAVLHALVVIKYGLKDKAYTPFLVFLFIDAVLALIVFLHLPYALWATLLLSTVGLVGLTLTFQKPQRNKAVDTAIWLVDLVIVVWAGYLLFAA